MAYDDLYYTETHTFEHGGRLFSGVSEEQFENGMVRCRVRFQDGRPHGDVEESYESGTKRSVTPYTNGAVHGRTVEWHENGVVRLERDNDYGIMMCCRTFDEMGALVDEYVRPNDDLLIKYVRRRKTNA